MSIDRAEINKQDPNGNTALHHAVVNGPHGYYLVEPNWEKVIQLLEDGIDVSIKNHDGHAAHNLIYGTDDCEKPNKETSWKYTNKIMALKTKYFGLIAKHQPNFNSILFIMLHRHFDCINPGGLSQDCLEKIVYWCEQGIRVIENKPPKKDRLRRKLIPETDWQTFLEDNHGSYLTETLKNVQLRCQNELKNLKKFPSLLETVVKLVHPHNQEAIILSLLTNNRAKIHLLEFFSQTNQLPISEQHKEQIKSLEKKYLKKKAQIESGYPLLTMLNEDGQKKVANLIDDVLAHYFDRLETNTTNESHRNWAAAVYADRLRNRVQPSKEEKAIHAQRFSLALHNLPKNKEPELEIAQENEPGSCTP